MLDEVLLFIEKHEFIIITTHDPADPDGLGAELTFACILQNMQKNFKIINASPIPPIYKFVDKNNTVESWDSNLHSALLKKSALLIVDTSDEYTIGKMRDIIGMVKETFYLDHHESATKSTLRGYSDYSAASVSQLAVETAMMAGIALDQQAAIAAYAGMVYDSGYFSYQKTSRQTFAIAFYLVNKGVVPYQVYRELSESASTGALLLHKQVFSSLELYLGGRVAVQILRKEDLLKTGAYYEDAETFINVPLKAKDIEVSILIKENTEGKVRCSMRSKGKVNVSKIAQGFSGGGHVSAAGFRSNMDIDKTIEVMLKPLVEKIEMQLDCL
jgi:phosphoesterase RecJ-like protein